MLNYMNSRSVADILYYELLDRPIQELENNKLLKIDWYTENVVHQVTLERHSHRYLTKRFPILDRALFKCLYRRLHACMM